MVALWQCLALDPAQDLCIHILWSPMCLPTRRGAFTQEASGLCFSIYRIVDRRAFDRITMSKEVYANSRQMYIFLVF